MDHAQSSAAPTQPPRCGTGPWHGRIRSVARTRRLPRACRGVLRGATGLPRSRVGASRFLVRVDQRCASARRHLGFRRPVPFRWARRPSSASRAQGQRGCGHPSASGRSWIECCRGPRRRGADWRRSGRSSSDEHDLLEPAFAVSAVEVRLHNTTLYNSLFRFDDDLLVNMHAYGAVAAQSPVMHLRRISGGRLFPHYMRSFERVWDEATPHAIEPDAANRAAA